LIKSELNPNIDIFLENNNESWNPRFHGAIYSRIKGRIKNPEHDKNMYREGYKFYVQDSIRIFDVFNNVFPRERTNRVIGSFQWNPSLTKGLLEYQYPSGTHKGDKAYKHYDSIAIGTYFYMCYDKNSCKDSIGLTSLDNSLDVENYIMRDRSNRYGIPALIKAISEHGHYTTMYHKDLISYEGGLHLTVQQLSHKDSKHYVSVIKRFNNSKHAYNLYKNFLDLCNEQGVLKTWIAFTSPQTYHKWGAFGIQETINKESYKSKAINEF